ncbi:MAG TPA: pyridoxamine 5'-phosphate oxidase family protein, partial [Rubrivivax sp.]|nr:pyridoxamine 5'-phosphate oxidase family protein [Rubrivivax sp.]
MTRIDSLSLIEAGLWQELQIAAQQPGHEWRTMVLATIDGDEAQARSVMLREVDAAAHELLFFTDSRSAKVAQMRARPIGTLLCWSSLVGWQLRLRVQLQVDSAGLQVSSRWARLKMTPAAQDYLSPLPPGSPVADRYAPERASRNHFAVVTAKVLAIDWLELHADGHRRARFGPDGEQ